MTHSYRSKDFDIFMGIDVDKNSYSFTVRDHDVMIRHKRIPANPVSFHNYIRNTCSGQKVLCAYEAGPTGFGLCDYLETQDIPCIIAHPLAMSRPMNERVKTNRIDSDKLCQQLQSGQIQPIRVPQGIWRDLRHLAGCREHYARHYKSAKQRIKSLLLLEGLHTYLKEPEAKWSARYLKELKTIPCSSAVRARLDMLINDFEYHRTQLHTSLRQLRAFGRTQPLIMEYLGYLQSIPGVGFVTATTVLGKIGNPEYLRNVRELAAFSGLSPRERSTGDTVKKGSITHLGSQTLRFVLVEAAWVAIRYDTELSQFYCRIKSRHHPRIGSQKAIVAVARKLTQIIYRVLKDRRNYIRH